MKKEQLILIASLTLLFPVLEFFFQKYDYFKFYAHIGIIAIAVSTVVFTLHYIKQIYWKLSIV
ncbi:hypothetical protein COK91_06210 [Bacillus cereus]|uniref:hypothetical protein n=1 Tax=Bacillus cereus TaxID=1396 RepID=UPI000BF91949|nr:hypothetical protein [Bacillus cereus]MDA2393453.1 hypothetical protein [Bacillus cereus]PFU83802.1 hypothetical protein COK91_06210 [Bacillus cereus]